MVVMLSKKLFVYFETLRFWPTASMAQSYRRHQRSAFFLSQTQNIFHPRTKETMWCLKKMVILKMHLKWILLFRFSFWSVSIWSKSRNLRLLSYSWQISTVRKTHIQNTSKIRPSVLHAQVVRGVAPCNHLWLKAVASVLCSRRNSILSPLNFENITKNTSPLYAGHIALSIKEKNSQTDKSLWASLSMLLKSSESNKKSGGWRGNLMVFKSPTQQMENSLRLEVCILSHEEKTINDLRLQ